ncbi:hypothetical protein [Ekhidna sp.]|uniref:hypothetical protein n=1 Tax=Ekhidna sp. TaxID=2608089 RepID=UPI003515A8C7
MDLAFKKEVHDTCVKLLEGKIGDLEAELAAVRESAISETKSSMGDKYETGREMMMQEGNRLSHQLDLYLSQLATLKSIDAEKSLDHVKSGSLIQTNKGWFYISAPIGQVVHNEKRIFVISPSAPLAKEMMNKAINDSFTFNGQAQTIVDLI